MRNLRTAIVAWACVNLYLFWLLMEAGLYGFAFVVLLLTPVRVP